MNIVATNTAHARIVFCSGMPRSASTWSFNVCRLLLAHAHGDTGMISCWGGTGVELDRRLADIRSASRPSVVKFHRATRAALAMVADGLACNVFTHREPLEAVASCIEMFECTFAAALEKVRNALQLQEQYSAIGGTLFIDYRGLTKEPAVAIARIASFLGVAAPDEVVNAICQKTSIAAAVSHTATMSEYHGTVNGHRSRYDPVTLLHPHHIRRHARKIEDTLSAEQIAEARRALSTWMSDGQRP